MTTPITHDADLPDNDRFTLEEMIMRKGIKAVVAMIQTITTPEPEKKFIKVVPVEILEIGSGSFYLGKWDYENGLGMEMDEEEAKQLCILINSITSQTTGETL